MGKSLWEQQSRNEERGGVMRFRADGYPQAFYGVKVPHAKGAIPLSNSVRAREIALIWLREARGRDEYVDEAYDYLSGWKRSIFERVQREGLRGIFE